MQPHQQRVVDEKAELDEKLTKLRAFCSAVGGVFDSLPTEEKQRLTEQEGHMAAYSDVLGRRIAQTEQPEPCKNCPPGHKCDHYGCMRGRFTAPSQAEQPTVAVQTAWEWAGGNPGIKATAEELKVALQELDKACDEKAEPAEKAQPELCMCKDRPKSKCPGEWEPGCDLGNNPAYVRVVPAPAAPFPLSANGPTTAPGQCPTCGEYSMSARAMQGLYGFTEHHLAAPPAAPQPAAPRPEFVGGDLEMLPEDLSALRAMVKAAYRLAPELRAKKLAAAPQPQAAQQAVALTDADLTDECKTLRYELTRAIAQRDDEGDRLDWLMVRLITLDGVTTRARLRQLANTSDPAEFRARLDEERGERGQCVRRMSDSRICGLRAASCPDCGPAAHDVPQGA